VKVTCWPAQIVAGAEVSVTVTGRFGFTVIGIEFDVAGLFEVQVVFEEVSTQVTISLFAGIYDIAGADDHPPETPFTNHE
jgi:hypothetical protein